MCFAFGSRRGRLRRWRITTQRCANLKGRNPSPYFDGSGSATTHWAASDSSTYQSKATTGVYPILDRRAMTTSLYGRHGCSRNYARPLQKFYCGFSAIGNLCVLGMDCGYIRSRVCRLLGGYVPQWGRSPNANAIETSQRTNVSISRCRVAQACCRFPVRHRSKRRRNPHRCRSNGLRAAPHRR